jgi:hypothetical protein
MEGHPGFPVDCVHPLRHAAHPDAIPGLKISPCPPTHFRPVPNGWSARGAAANRSSLDPTPSPHYTDRLRQGPPGVHGHLEAAEIGAARATHPRQFADQIPFECWEDAIPLMELCPGQDTRLIAFITETGPIRKILAHLGEPLEPPPVSPARGPPTDWGELVQAHDDRDVLQGRIDELPVIDIHSL